MRRLIILFISLILPGSSFALELQEALTAGYQYNDELKSVRNNFLNEIEQFPQAFSEFMPRVSLQADRSYQKNKVPRDFSDTISREVNSQTGSLNIKQPIFNGGGSVAGLKAAQSAFRASRGKYYANEQKTLLKLIETYLDYYETKEKYEISESKVKTNLQQLNTVEEKLKLGEANEIDIATARAGLSAAETNKLTAYANFQAQKASFMRSFGIEPTDAKLPPLPDNLPASLEELMKKSAQLSPEIDSARHNVKSSKANEFVSKAALLPQVDFSVQTGKRFYDPQSLSTVNDKSTTSTLSVTIPIYAKGGAEYSRIRKDKYATRSSAIQLHDAMNQVRANAISSWEGFNAAKSRIIASTQGVEAAQIAYEGTVQEEIVGSKTILDVLTAQDKLYEAKTSKVDAHKASILAAYQIKALTGELTAQSLKLKTPYFSPEDEFKRLKTKLVIGF